MNELPTIDDWLFQTIDTWIERQIEGGSFAIAHGKVCFYVSSCDECRTFERKIVSWSKLIDSWFEDDRPDQMRELAGNLRAAADQIEEHLNRIDQGT